MVAPVRVVVVFAISVTDEEKSLTVDFCHLTTDPVFPDSVKSFGELPLQMVWLDETVPPTDVAFTVIVAMDELACGQTPLCTTALKYVITVSGPIDAPVRVVVVFAISVTLAEKSLTVDFCHLITDPVFPLNIKSFGLLPLQIV